MCLVDKHAQFRARVLCDPCGLPTLKRYFFRWKHDVSETKPSRGELSWYCRWKSRIRLLYPVHYVVTLPYITNSTSVHYKVTLPYITNSTSVHYKVTLPYITNSTSVHHVVTLPYITNSTSVHYKVTLPYITNSTSVHYKVTLPLSTIR
ncbi:unnamed protein product [Boreogadus saida]